MLKHIPLLCWLSQRIRNLSKAPFCLLVSPFSHFNVHFVRLHLKCDGTHAETIFRLLAKQTSPFKSAGGGGVSSVDYWQASCAHQPAGFVLLMQACVLQSYDAYWLPTPFWFPLHFSCASLCAITFQKQSTPDLYFLHY
jgi:hypothetical protein